jgi:apolipoprotein N-acyltransferase
MLRRRWSKAALAALSGALTAVALPGPGLGPLVFLSLIPFYIALETGGPLVGFCYGAALFAVDLRWILTLRTFSPLIGMGYVLIVAYLALPFLVVGVVSAWHRQRTGRVSVLLVTCLMVLAEYVRAQGPLGIGFTTLYSAFYHAPWLIQSASWFGAWFVSGCIVAINGALYRTIRTRRLRPMVAAATAFFLLVVPALLPHYSQEADPVRVAVVSSDVRQTTKLDSRNLPELTERYFSLLDRAASEAPDLIALPESFLPAYILQRSDLLSALSERAQQADASLLFGTGDIRNRQIYNLVVLLDPSGSVVSTYAMVRPVPFGETIPGRALWSKLGLDPLMDSFIPVDLSAGTAYEPLDGIGTPICFESTLPTAARSFVRNGATFLVTVTNDAWFDRSSELAAHFACAVFRAVETRRWIVQAANGGISGFVSPEGSVAETTQNEGVLLGDVVPQTGRSPYVIWGDAPLVAGTSITTLLLLAAALTRRRRKDRGK